VRGILYFCERPLQHIHRLVLLLLSLFYRSYHRGLSLSFGVLLCLSLLRVSSQTFTMHRECKQAAHFCKPIYMKRGLRGC
jgi:hypothetical protein